MPRTIKYEHDYYDDVSHINVPELNGLPLKETPYEFFLDDSYLDIEEFTYEYEFEEFDEDGEEYEEDVFRPFILTKIGGSGMTAKGDQYYDELTRREVDGIVKEFIQEALGLTDFEVTTESDDFSI